jgi:myo-inositol-1(or 4)-monophosphatase
MQKLLNFAESTVYKAGNILKGEKKYQKVLYEKENDDLVTEGDKFIQDFVKKAIKKTYPNHGIYSEENLQEKVNSEYLWILDPIDGTKYFSRGIPLYTISLALQHKGNIILGIVYNPETNQMFCASKEKGATLNQKKIKCSQKKTLKEATIYTQIPCLHSPVEEKEQFAQKISLLINHVKRVRIVGVTSLGLCWCSMGAFDLYLNFVWHSSTKIWDKAAGEVILKESNGVITEIDNIAIAGDIILTDKMQLLLNI